MTIDQHAEAAAKELTDRFPFKPFPEEQITDTREVLCPHMQSAIDEALAEKMIGVLDNASNHVHEVDLLKARIAELEGLGPLIEEYASERMRQAEAEAIDEWGDRKMFENRADRAKAKITAILKGGAS